MQAYIAIGGIIISLFAQWANTHPRVPAPVVKLALALIGLALYLVVDQPAAWSGQPLFEWLDEAWVWALALPGAASLAALAPGMATNSKQ